MPAQYRFSFGPWNLHEGADPFGPPVRPVRDFSDKLAIAKRLGFQALQFHDDDVVPAEAPVAAMERGTGEIRRMLADHGLEAEFIAPRLWEDPRTIDGAVTSNSAADRQYALDRSKRAVDIARLMGTRNIVWWPARQALERPPQRPERSQVRSGQGVRVSGPSPRAESGDGARARWVRLERRVRRA